MIRRYLLPLDLQYFAQDPPAPTDPPADPPGGDPQDPPPTDPPKPLDEDERQELIQLRKTAAIQATGLTDPQDVENMQTHLAGLEGAADIQAKIDAILAELKLGKFQQQADPSAGNGFRQQHKAVSNYDTGKQLFHRIRNKRR